MDDGNDPYFHDQADGKSGDSVVNRPRRGCLFYGCIGALVVGALTALLLAVLTVYLYRFSSRFVEQYTAMEPEPVAVVALPEEQIQAVESRVDAFQDAASDGQPATLSLTADELNALIARDPDLRGRVAVEIDGNQLLGHLSFPLEQIGLPALFLGGLKGRYLNGTARFTPLLRDDGKLAVRVDELIVKGQAVPDEFLDELRQADLTIDFTPEDSEKAAFVEGLERIEVKEGQLVLTSRRDATDAESDDGESADPAPGPHDDRPAPPPPDPPEDETPAES